MGIESATTIAGLNSAWPLGTDSKNQGDDHLRLIKAVMKADALSRAAGGAINGSVSVNGSFSVINAGGNMLLKNANAAGALGTWSLDISESAGTFQITPRDNTGAAIAGGGALQLQRNSGGVVDFLLAGSQPANQAPTASSILWRARGDNRYTLSSSSQRFKDDVLPADLPEPDSIGPMTWTWGGELDEDDARRGSVGYGLVAEQVDDVLPVAVLRDADGLVQGLDHGALIGALWGLVVELRARVAALEGARDADTAAAI